MKNKTTRKPHIVFLFSDTGGGHRSAAEAIIEAIEIRYKGKVTTEMVDYLKEYSPKPLDKLPDWYPFMVKSPNLWGLSYKMSDGRLRARAITVSVWPYVGRSARAFVKEHPADMIVSVHPLATTTILKALGKSGPPFITVVTDWISNHALWYDQRSSGVIVPTEIAKQGAIRYQMDPRKVFVTGFPVSRRHCAPAGRKARLREKLGWPKKRMIVLLLGGREGMGPLTKTLEAINHSNLDLNVVVVAGKNVNLRKDLESRKWNIPTTIYGFVDNLPDFMRAADVIITKAGAATVAESLNAGLPMIFHSLLPGQEEGNVQFVSILGAGIWAPKPEMVINTLSYWRSNPEALRQFARVCRSNAHPDAATKIADILVKKIGKFMK